MAIKTIAFKNANLAISNSTELNIAVDVFDGADELGNIVVAVDIRGKTKAQIIAEGKELLKDRAKALLEAKKPVYDFPKTLLDFNMDVEYQG